MAYASSLSLTSSKASSIPSYTILTAKWYLLWSCPWLDSTSSYLNSCTIYCKICHTLLTSCNPLHLLDCLSSCHFYFSFHLGKSLPLGCFWELLTSKISTAGQPYHYHIADTREIEWVKSNSTVWKIIANHQEQYSPWAEFADGLLWGNTIKPTLMFSISMPLNVTLSIYNCRCKGREKHLNPMVLWKRSSKNSLEKD